MCLFRWVGLLIRWLRLHEQVVFPGGSMLLSFQRLPGLVGPPYRSVHADTRIYAPLKAQLSQRCCKVATEGHGHTSKLLSDNDFLQESIQSIMGETDMRHMAAGASDSRCVIVSIEVSAAPALLCFAPSHACLCLQVTGELQPCIARFRSLRRRPIHLSPAWAGWSPCGDSGAVEDGGRRFGQGAGRRQP